MALGAAVGVAAVVVRAADARAVVALRTAVSVTVVGVAPVSVAAFVGHAVGVPAVMALGAAVGVAAVAGRAAGVPSIVAMGAAVCAEPDVVRVAGAAAEALGAAVRAVVNGGRARRGLGTPPRAWRLRRRRCQRAQRLLGPAAAVCGRG